MWFRYWLISFTDHTWHKYAIELICIRKLQFYLIPPINQIAEMSLKCKWLPWWNARWVKYMLNPCPAEFGYWKYSNVLWCQTCLMWFVSLTGSFFRNKHAARASIPSYLSMLPVWLHGSRKGQFMWRTSSSNCRIFLLKDSHSFGLRRLEWLSRHLQLWIQECAWRTWLRHKSEDAEI